MKRIAILTCLEAVGSVCTGAGCLSALNTRQGSFKQYDEAVKLEAFFQCNGCQSDVNTDKGVAEKLQRIIQINPDVVHIGICTKTKTGELCKQIQAIKTLLEEKGILCIEGTH